MSTITELKWQALTPAVNKILSPNQFLKKLLFSMHESKSLETIAIDTVKKGRSTAPFVRKNGEAIMVGGYTENFAIVEGPNIRIKRPIAPSDLMNTRRAGTSIMPDDAQLSAARQLHIAREQQVLADLVTNSEEYLCALSIQGTIAYSVADQENFTITLPKPAANKIDLALKWDDPDPSLPTIENDFKTAKRLVSQSIGLAVTDVVLGQKASDAFTKVMKKQFGAFWNAAVFAGTVTLAEAFDKDGVLYLGTFCGVRVWEYSRHVSVDGTDTPLIRDSYAEFLAIAPEAENVLYYAAIPDDEVPSGVFVGERFSKSWVKQDPSTRLLLVHSRPLPIQRKPESGVSMKVTA